MFREREWARNAKATERKKHDSASALEFAGTTSLIASQHPQSPKRGTCH